MLIRQGFPTFFHGRPTRDRGRDKINLFNFKLPMHMGERKLLPKGFAANFVLISWSVLGSVIGYAFLANFLTMLIKPVLEKPIDSVQDIVDRGMVPIATGQHYIDFLKKSANPLNRQLAEITIKPKGVEERLNLIKERILKVGTSVYIFHEMNPDELDTADFYISKDVLEGLDPYVGWIVNKKWPLSEKLAQHIFIYQQVGGLF